MWLMIFVLALMVGVTIDDTHIPAVHTVGRASAGSRSSLLEHYLRQLPGYVLGKWLSLLKLPLFW